MCGGRKKASDRDPFPPSKRPQSQRVNPPTLPRWSEKEMESSGNDSESILEQASLPDSWLMRMDTTDTNVYDSLEKTDDGIEKRKEGIENRKGIVKKKDGPDLNQTGARYGHISGAPHREYASLEEINNMIEKEEKKTVVKKEKSVGGKTLETRNQTGARYGSMNGSHREYMSMDELSEIIEESEAVDRRRIQKTVEYKNDMRNQSGARFGHVSGTEHRDYDTLGRTMESE